MSFLSTILADVESIWAKIFGTEGATIAEDVVTDIQLIGSGLSGALAGFESATGLDADLINKIQTYIANIKTATATITTTVETNIAKPVVSQIMADFSALKSVLSGVTLPAVITDIMNAVTVVLPYIEAGVGMLTAATVGDAEKAGITVDEARLILKGA